MRTARCNAFRRGRDDAFQPRTNELLLRFDGRCCNRLAGQHVRQKDSRARIVTQAFAAVNKFFNFQFHRLIPFLLQADLELRCSSLRCGKKYKIPARKVFEYTVSPAFRKTGSASSKADRKGSVVAHPSARRAAFART